MRVFTSLLSFTNDIANFGYKQKKSFRYQSNVRVLCDGRPAVDYSFAKCSIKIRQFLLQQSAISIWEGIDEILQCICVQVKKRAAVIIINIRCIPNLFEKRRKKMDWHYTINWSTSNVAFAQEYFWSIAWKRIQYRLDNMDLWRKKNNYIIIEKKKMRDKWIEPDTLSSWGRVGEKGQDNIYG